MSITRINEFRAKDGSAEALRAFLAHLIPIIAAIPGCQSCQLLQRSPLMGPDAVEYL